MVNGGCNDDDDSNDDDENKIKKRERGRETERESFINCIPFEFP